MERASTGLQPGMEPIAGESAVPCVMGGLTIMRCLGMAKIPYVALEPTGDARDEYVFRSRYCLEGKVTADPKDDPRKTLADLIAMGKRLPRRAPLYYSADQQWRLVSEHREELSRYFQFLMPDEATMEATLDKSAFAAYCEQHGILAPQSYYAPEVFEKERAGFAWRYPLIFKPTSHVYWFNSRLIRNLQGLEYKGIVVENHAQFADTLGKLEDEKIPFLLQQFIPGGDENIHSFHAFFDENSMPLGCFAGKKIRTFPPVTGESTYIELQRNEELCRLAIAYMQRLKFTGPVKLDFKYNHLDGKYYLLEINARYNLWHYLGAHAGINLPAMAYYHFIGQPRTAPAEYRTDVRWMRARYDFRALLAYRRRGEATLGGYLASLMTPKIYSKFAWHDPLPTVYALGSFARKRIPFLKNSSVTA